MRSGKYVKSITVFFYSINMFPIISHLLTQIDVGYVEGSLKTTSTHLPYVLC